MQPSASLSLLLISLSWTASPQQTPEQQPAFDAVSIRQIEASQRSSTPGTTSFVFAPHKQCVYSEEKVLCQLSLEELIREAYQRRRYEIHGPMWLSEDLFVFQAILARSATKDETHLMMQKALAERFGLSVHTERKALKAYIMEAGPHGIQLTPAELPERQKKLAGVGGRPAYVTSSRGSFAAVAMKLDDLASWIERDASLDAPVLNGTGLETPYKIDLHWDTNDNAEKDDGILNALKTQAGIILHKQDVPIEVFTIDKVNRTPTAN